MLGIIGNIQIPDFIDSYAIADAAWDILDLSEDKFPNLLSECFQRAEKSRVFLNFI